MSLVPRCESNVLGSGEGGDRAHSNPLSNGACVRALPTAPPAAPRAPAPRALTEKPGGISGTEMTFHLILLTNISKLMTYILQDAKTGS